MYIHILTCIDILHTHIFKQIARTSIVFTAFLCAEKNQLKEKFSLGHNLCRVIFHHDGVDILARVWTANHLVHQLGTIEMNADVHFLFFIYWADYPSP